MTREEILNGLRFLRNSVESDEDYEIFDTAIKIIEQEPCEDCVSRAELKKWLDMNFSFGGALRKLELFDRLDKELPSVTPKGVTITDFADRCRECGREKVLDKIRAEIDDYLYNNEFGTDYRVDIANIIDKYNAEMESEE